MGILFGVVVGLLVGGLIGWALRRNSLPQIVSNALIGALGALIGGVLAPPALGMASLEAAPTASGSVLALVGASMLVVAALMWSKAPLR